MAISMQQRDVVDHNGDAFARRISDASKLMTEYEKRKCESVDDKKGQPKLPLIRVGLRQGYGVSCRHKNTSVSNAPIQNAPPMAVITRGQMDGCVASCGSGT
jgi:hypothetical protein